MLVFRKRLAIITTTGFHTIATMSMIVEIDQNLPDECDSIFPWSLENLSFSHFLTLKVSLFIMFPGNCYPDTSGRLGLVAFLDQIKNIVGRCLSQLRNGNWLYCKHEKREAAGEPTVLSIVKLSLVCVCTRLCKEEAFPFIACID